MPIRSLIKSSAVFLLAVASLSAQRAATPAAAPKAGAIPRAADGHPDLTGVWSNATRTPFERPDTFAGKASLTVPGPLYEYACHEGNYAIVDILGGK